MSIMVTGKFDDLFNKYRNGDYFLDRMLRLKLREIAACYEECNVEERIVINTIIDKFCEAVDLIEERNDAVMSARLGIYGSEPTTLNCFMAVNKTGNCETLDETEREPYDPEMILGDFYYHFIKIKSESTMRDYVARIKTFAYSEQYLTEMIDSGVLDMELYTEPINFIYENIELILARFNTKDSNGNTVKQRNNIRSALRLFNEFKCFREGC